MVQGSEISYSIHAASSLLSTSTCADSQNTFAGNNPDKFSIIWGVKTSSKGSNWQLELSGCSWQRSTAGTSGEWSSSPIFITGSGTVWCQPTSLSQTENLVGSGNSASWPVSSWTKALNREAQVLTFMGLEMYTTLMGFDPFLDLVLLVGFLWCTLVGRLPSMLPAEIGKTAVQFKRRYMFCMREVDDSGEERA